VVVDVGETVRGDPVLLGVTGVVHPELVYHVQLAPEPSVPPATASEVDPPEHTLVGFADALVAAEDELLKLTVTLLKAVFPHVPSART
jgi:hypothetical protein